MRDIDLKNVFLNTVKPFIGNNNFDENEILKLHLNDTEIDSLMLMEIIMELESQGVRVNDSFISALRVML